jgi:hypothetical protein
MGTFPLSLIALGQIRPDFGAEAINLPPAVARRRLMAGGFLEE